MHIEFLVEEQSAEAALLILVPKIIGSTATFATHAFQGKSDLLKKLPSRLRAYHSWLPDDWRIVVLIDEDRQDCMALKANLEQAAHDAGFVTRSNSTEGSFHVINRLAIEELEAWYFGDIQALVAAYPRVNPNLGKQAKYRNPDAIKGGTWEALERVLQKNGYYPTGLPKIEAARQVAMHMIPNQNTSASFQVFSKSLVDMVS
jgi:hypothetical protein